MIIGIFLVVCLMVVVIDAVLASVALFWNWVRR
jgi:hypothetical protein